MPNFPKKEPEVMTLALEMASGLVAHATDFPSVDPAPLATALAAYQNQKISQADARAQAQIATDSKNSKLDELLAEMKKALKLAEVDTSADPAKLTEIGWGPKAPPTPLTPPGQPTDLIAVNEGPGTLELQWTRPTSGGAVRNYLVQRRDMNPAGEFGSWQLIDLFYDTLITLAAQPRGMEMEYRVVAMNAAGASLPGNVIAVVL